MSDLIVTTMNDLPGYQVEEVFGEVFGLTVRSLAGAWLQPRPSWCC
ncbi:MAG TPA: heavy metal-binding domain-containing protein [Gaiella sp.]|jgi:uncharacterized protein YbjQ (UPF0145 family)|nr:heavy metal-binding domain-containing protein [Gaiella sp.]HEX5585141.1 heavy metal-binding domain-containing protein [Gaiella sp.]